MILLSIVACAQQNQQEMKSSQTDKKVLVVYFSATGTTKTIAQKVAKAAKGRLYENSSGPGIHFRRPELA